MGNPAAKTASRPVSTTIAERRVCKTQRFYHTDISRGYCDGMRFRMRANFLDLSIACTHTDKLTHRSSLPFPLSCEWIALGRPGFSFGPEAMLQSMLCVSGACACAHSDWKWMETDASHTATYSNGAPFEPRGQFCIYLFVEMRVSYVVVHKLWLMLWVCVLCVWQSKWFVVRNLRPYQTTIHPCWRTFVRRSASFLPFSPQHTHNARPNSGERIKTRVCVCVLRYII